MIAKYHPSLMIIKDVLIIAPRLASYHKNINININRKIYPIPYFFR